MACIIGRSVVNPRYKKIAPHRHYALYGHRYDYIIPVDCGRCINCLKKYLGNWSFRLQQEFNHLPRDVISNSFFVTLTIEPEFYTEKKPLLIKMVRRFLERVRKNYGRSVRHFLITERGENFGRYHFHGFLIDIPFPPNELYNLWHYGFADVVPLDNSEYPLSQRISYITTYITKGKKSKIDVIIAPEDFPLVLTSPGLGAAYADSKRSFHHQNNTYIPFADNGSRLVRLPRYLRQKIFSESELKELSYAYFNGLDDDVIPEPPYYIGNQEYNDYTVYLKDCQKYIKQYKKIYGK